MTPVRSTSSKRNSTTGFKPYTREIANLVFSSDMLDSKQSPETHCRADTLGSPDLNNNAQYVPVERPGFPTYAQYKQVEAAYIQSLTPRRQGKALISQALFDRIWDVLHRPDFQGETAQFRFWARKMFTLSKTHRNTLNGFDKHGDTPQEVLLHDNLLVAVQEQIYDLLCYCHGSTGHGGRDKTCSLIRKHYTWVPKDLVSNFIKACPTCIMKKCGNIDSALATQMAEHRADHANFSRITEFLANYTSSADTTASGSLPTLPSPGPNIKWPTFPGEEYSGANNMQDVDPTEAAYREAVRRARNAKASLSTMATPHPRGPQSVPMFREVSLYKGLPNGWQYRHSDYASAHAEFMKSEDPSPVQDGDPSTQANRPRIPSVLPLWGPEHFMQEEFSVEETDFGRSANILIPSLAKVSQQQDSEVQANASLRYMLLGHSQQPLDFKEEPQPFDQQIDPLLLEHSPGATLSTSKTITTEAGFIQSAHADNANLSTPMSLRRAAVPPRLDFSNQKFYFTTYRDNLREAGFTPDSPLTGIDWDQAIDPSPTGTDSPSSSSRGSQLSPFAMPPPMSATTSVSDAGSALRTPVDNFPNESKERDLKGGVNVEPAEIELSEGIKQVCGL